MHHDPGVCERVDIRNAGRDRIGDDGTSEAFVEAAHSRLKQRGHGRACRRKGCLYYRVAPPFTAAVWVAADAGQGNDTLWRAGEVDGVLERSSDRNDLSAVESDMDLVTSELRIPGGALIQAFYTGDGWPHSVPKRYATRLDVSISIVPQNGFDAELRQHHAIVAHIVAPTVVVAR